MNSLDVKAYAKINLTLDITGRLPNGYHSIRSIMQSISLCDNVTVERTDCGGIEVICDKKNIPSGEKNIAYKAAERFAEYADIACMNVKIHIEKHIPSEAGLGGGSSDAAAVIRCLNELYGCGYSEKRLCEIGSNVGADVPFCIIGGTALCEGIGEEITPLPALEEEYVLIAKGKLGISTPEAYARLDKTELSAKEWKSSDFSGKAEKWSRYCSNDFEKVSDNYEITDIKSLMKSGGALISQMSGSGSAVFGIFQTENEAVKCREMLTDKGYFAEVCRSKKICEE